MIEGYFTSDGFVLKYKGVIIYYNKLWMRVIDKTGHRMVFFPEYAAYNHLIQLQSKLKLHLQGSSEYHYNMLYGNN